MRPLSVLALVAWAVLPALGQQGPLGVKFQAPARLFPLHRVRLTSPELLKIRELDHQYLLALDSNRLLRNFRENAGIRTGIPPLADHESATGPESRVRGHYTGHYLSACAMMYASTGDRKLKAKADRMVAELARLQKPNGYLSAQPEAQFDVLETGKSRGIDYYVMHKVLAGLLDMYELAGNRQAFDIARRLGDWVDARTARLDHATMQVVLEREFGGIGEAMANLAALAGDEKYLRAARRFDHDMMLLPAAAGEDNLTKRHGNTNIPKFIDAARKYELLGEPVYAKGASFFWRQVALHRTYATGGNSMSESFPAPDALAATLTATTQETCNTHNMLKLTEHLFAWEPDAGKGDYYERALFNHILGTPHPQSGMPLYFLGLMPGQWKAHFIPHQTFWCCAGTGLENFAKLQRRIYYHGKDQLWVNLFVGSVLDWKEKGVTVRQQTAFPDEQASTIVVEARRPSAFKLNIRIPSWAQGASIAVNGKTVQADLQPGTLAVVDRIWKDRELVRVTLPMRLHLQPMPDDPKLAAILYGPIVLAGELGSVPLDRVQRPENNLRKWFQADPYPDADRLALTGVTDRFEDWIEPVPGKPLTFRTKAVGQPRDFVLSPFYRLFNQRYNVYWKLEFRKAQGGRR